VDVTALSFKASRYPPGARVLRLIWINERSAGGDPLAEFPKGNSLRRLPGGFVCPRWAYAFAMRVALVEAVSTNRHGERSIT
jgi:hypothetical protein